MTLYCFIFYVQPKCLSPIFIVQYLYSSSLCWQPVLIFRLSPPVPPILSCSVYYCVPSLSSILVLSVHSRVPKIHFFTTPLGYSPPWGEVSPAVIILSLLVMRLKTSLSYRQGLKRPKHQAERWDFKSHSLRHSSNTDLPLGVQVSAFVWQPCKTVVATYVLKIMPVTSLKPLRQEIPIYNIYFGDNLVSKQPSNPFSGIACQSNGVCNALQTSLSFSVTQRFFRLLWLLVLLFHLFHINNASASDNIKRNSFCEPGGCFFPLFKQKRSLQQ